MKTKKILLCSFILFGIILLVGCQPKTQGDTFVAKSGFMEITSGGGWIQAAEGDLNKNADLELRGKNMEKYAMILTDPASKFESYDAWYKTVVSNNASNYHFKEEDAKDITIDGFKSKYVEFETDFNGYKMYMRIYFLNSKYNYAQFFLWTLKANKDRLAGEFDNMANSIIYYELVEN